MKRHAPAVIALALFTAVAQAQTTPAGTPKPLEVRTHIPLTGTWSFHKGPLGTEPAAWSSVTVPHTWNAQDGQDGGDNYYRGEGTYRRTLALPTNLAGKQLYLRFEGANRDAEVTVNDQLLGKHIGGNGAFTFDATAILHSGDNPITVHVSNARDNDTSPPLFKDGERGGADYTYWGGIYRPVELIAVSPLHIALNNYASPGVFISTPDVTDTLAKVQVRTQVENSGKTAEPSVVTIEIFNAQGKSVAKKDSNVTVATDKTQDVITDLVIPNPHRWNGRPDPYLYSVKVTLQAAAEFEHLPPLDTLTQPLGIRTFSIDPEKGFFLNGKSYPLHGVNRHQDRKDKGWAISNEDHLQDMALIKEMGANTVRLAHYQHSDFFYELCDKEGIVVWAEVPVVNYVAPNKAYTDNAHDQLKELIRQSYNHPSIAFWSVGNEVRKPRYYDPFVSPDDVDPVQWFKDMSALCHAEDPYRLSAVACRRDTPYRVSTDVYGLNIYYGWYESTLANVDTYFSSLPHGWALTEYGAGASIYFHSDKPVKMDHSEEYQCIFFEANWAAIKKHPEIWGSYIWNMFDFAVDDRYEGDHVGINDKGLVTFDRAVKKDAFYFFQANWSQDPMVHLNGKRFPVHGLQQINMKAYSNAPKVALAVNGKFVSEKNNDGNGTFPWENVPLNQGPNDVKVTATFEDGKTRTDTTTFTYTPGAPTEIYVAQDETMKAVYAKAPPRGNYPKNPFAPPTRKPPPGGPPVQPNPAP